MTEVERITIILKNTTASGVTMADLAGATVSGYGEYYLTDYFSFATINTSEELPPLVASGILTVNDGVQDLFIEGGLKHIRYATAYETEVTFEDKIGAMSLLELSDTPSVYNYGKFLQSTISGTVWTTVSGLSGVITVIDHIEDEIESSTTSTNYQQKLRLTTDPIPAGEYIIKWYYEWQYKHGSFDFKSRIQIDDTIGLMEHIAEPTKVTNWYPASGYKRETLTAGSHYIDLDYCGSKSGKEAKIRRTSLELWRVS